jgi:tRNA-2-methylthio-N6-dimethylallyladenosine synthase
MQQLLESNGYSRAASYNDANLILLNTCTVRQKAEDKIYSELGRIKRFKKINPDVVIGVVGCLAQQEGQRLINKYPYVDLVLGTRTLPRLIDILGSMPGRKPRVVTSLDEADDIYPAGQYTVAPGSRSAFLTIMQGCDNFCSYCIVPSVRGREWSRSPDVLMREASHLAQQGIREITLLGQNVNAYGKTSPAGVTFAQLLSRLNGINGLQRIRFTTSHPKDLSPELIACFGQLDKVCEHIHLPLQSGSNKILKRMSRGYTREEYLDKIAALRMAFPGISITSDIIVGFPGETENDFHQTLLMIEEVRFDDLFIFHYTDRSGTKASQFRDTVPYPEKIERLKVLNEVQRSISLEKNSTLIGTVVSVLFEERSKKGITALAGRTRTNKVVNSRASDTYLGMITEVRIEKANIHSLAGSILPQEHCV